jgi:zinc D-Ala-D-Ala dipeptidase
MTVFASTLKFRRMAPIRVQVAYWLWRLGAQAVLPAHFVSRIPIKDEGEKLIPILQTARLRLDQRVGIRHVARESVVRGLEKAAVALPDGYQLLVVDAYRSHARQIAYWNETRARFVAEHPQLDAEEINRRTRLVIADPTRGNTCGHQTGAAVDVTLTDETGTELRMGTAVGEFSLTTPMQNATDPEVANRRRILCACMSQSGFANYPGEWWHFSMGDQLWAAYLRKPTARFGPVQPQDES